jgi:hypothetical protein
MLVLHELNPLESTRSKEKQHLRDMSNYTTSLLYSTLISPSASNYKLTYWGIKTSTCKKEIIEIKMICIFQLYQQHDNPTWRRNFGSN